MTASNCKIGFLDSENDLAHNLYEKMVEEGALCEEIAGADGTLSANEILDYAFKNYQKYQLSMKGVLGQDLPWSQEERRGRVEKAMAQIEQILDSNGFKKGSDDFKEKLSLGLFYLAVAPKKFSSTMDKNRFMKLSEELVSVGLGEFRNTLLQEGGLAIDTTNGERQTTKLHSNPSLETTNLLYGIYEMAGLSPKFEWIHRNGQQLGNKLVDSYFSQLPPDMGHAFVSIAINGQQRSMDLLFTQTDAYRDNYTQLSPREYFSRIAVARGDSWMSQGEKQIGFAEFKLALKMDSKNVEAYVKRGMAHLNLGNLDLAIGDFNKSIEIDSKSTFAYLGLSCAFSLKGNLNEAIKYGSQFLQKTSNTELLWTELLKYLQPVYLHDSNRRMTANQFSNETKGQINLERIEASFLLAYSLWEAGGPSEKAIKELKDIESAVNFNRTPSETTKLFFNTMLSGMPQSMSANSDIKGLIQKLRSKFNNTF